MIGSFIFAISLSIDALGIGISYGVRHIRVPVAAKIIVAIISAFFTGLSLMVGIQLANVLPEQVSNFIGVGLLFFMGCWIIFQEFRPAKKIDPEPKKSVKNNATVFQFIIKSLGITIQIIQNPKSGDLDASKSIEPTEAIYLGVALAIDSIGAGIAVATLGLNSFILPIFVAVAQFCFLSIGSLIGEKVSKIKIHSKAWVVISGGLLITMAVLRIL